MTERPCVPIAQLLHERSGAPVEQTLHLNNDVELGDTIDLITEVKRDPVANSLVGLKTPRMAWPLP